MSMIFDMYCPFFSLLSFRQKTKDYEDAEVTQVVREQGRRYRK